ncbi:hypothetical protein SAMN04487897_12438 [Paenibacillus sp. yr247]|nr:hypothetical protein SAMN04487897_12438 [Paenibacillus sp. yr247]
MRTSMMILNMKNLMNQKMIRPTKIISNPQYSEIPAWEPQGISIWIKMVILRHLHKFIEKWLLKVRKCL